MLSFLSKTARMPTAASRLPGRAEPIATSATHYVNGIAR